MFVPQVDGVLVWYAFVVVRSTLDIIKTRWTCSLLPLRLASGTAVFGGCRWCCHWFVAAEVFAVVASVHVRL